MSRIECLFQSIQQTGSIYGLSSTLSSDHLEKYACKAIVIIRRHKKAKVQGSSIQKLQHITIKTQNSQDHLSSLFLRAANFISDNKTNTNIIIWSPESWQLGATFFFAYLILKYSYTLQYILKGYDKKLKPANIPECYMKQLERLAKDGPSPQKPAKCEEQDQLYQTVLGKRILRIRKEYSELGKDSLSICENKKIQRTTNRHNPEKQKQTKPQKRRLSTSNKANNIKQPQQAQIK